MNEQPPWQPQEPPYGQQPFGQQQWDKQAPESQSSFYNQPIQPAPPQFQRPPYNNFPPPKRQSGIRQWYKSRTKKVKISIGCGIILAVLLFFSCIGTAVGSVNLATQSTPKPTTQPHQAAILVSPAVTATPTPTSPSTPTPKPTSTLTPSQTPTPTLTSPNPTQPNNGIKLGWSSGYYVGWLQSTYPPQTIPWKDFTHIIHFSLKTNRDGSLMYTHGMTPAFMQALVTEAHKHNVKALLSIGGDDDQNWDGACSSASRATFVHTLVSTMQTYGYDGLDLDIEQDFGYPNYTDYASCIQQLRSALDKITPRPTLSMAVVPEWQAYQASHAWQYIDQLNMMSYGTDASRIGNLINNFTSLGFPKSRLGIGIDFVANDNAPWCGGLAQYAVNNGVGGIMEWVITEDQAQHNGQTPCLNAISNYVPLH